MKFKNIYMTLVMVLIALTTITAFASFKDIKPETKMGEAIIRMKERGYINGFGDGTFRPYDGLTRAEFVTIINKMYNYTVESPNIFKDVSTDDWFYSDVLRGVQAGYIRGMGDGTFKPNDKVTREQVCVMLDNILNIQITQFDQEISDNVSAWAKESVENMLANRIFMLEDAGKFRATQDITRGEACVALEKCIIDIDMETE
jgi:hypothetical protein